MHKPWIAAAALLLSLLAFNPPVCAQAAPPLNINLKEAMTLLPIPGIKGAIGELFESLKPTPGAGGWSSIKTVNVSGAGSLPLQLYVFGDADKQAVLLVVNSNIELPGVFNNRAWKRLAGSSFSNPIFSLSTVDFSLNVRDMPAEFRQVVAGSYFNVESLDFSNGFQVATQVHIGGVMKNVIEVGMGVPVQQFTLRAGVVLQMPTDTAGRASLAASMLADMKNVSQMLKEPPEFYTEFQLAPGKVITGPIGMQQMQLSDATLSITNEGTVGFRGNMSVGGSGKKFITFFDTPLNPAGAMDLLDFRFGMTAQSVTLDELMVLAMAMYTNQVPGGSFIRDLAQVERPLKTMLKPLSLFQLRNPKTVGEYRFADKSKPFPPMSAFNLLVLGPLATVDDGNGKTIRGPLLKGFGNATVLGQELASASYYLGEGGLRNRVSAGLSLKLGPLGRQSISMASSIEITKDKQAVELHGGVLGRKLDMSLSPTKFSLDSPATCATPFSLSQTVDIAAGLNVAALMDALPGVNVDPSKLPNCIGKDLEAAYKWVGSTGKDLAGYSAQAANAELDTMAKAAEADYDKAKHLARDKATKVSGGAMSAFNDAGNAFKKLGTKKKHRKGPDPKFASSVFDWDFYYDRYPDLVKNGVDLATHWRDSGFAAGRQGAPEFNAKYYRARYLDVQQACGVSDLACALQHWLDHGIEQGRQGSAEVSIYSYLKRSRDLQQSLGKENYADAMDHWLNFGEAEGRDSRPEDPSDGPLAGLAQVGGDGGGPWSDFDTCGGQALSGFRLRHGDRIDAVQFGYRGRGWAPRQGGGGEFQTEVVLPADEYIVQVDYRSGSRVDSLSFKTNRGKTYGPYGGSGGSALRYTVTPGEKLGCMSGRAGAGMDRLLLTSTGLR
jgi:hypothetical protein